MLFPINGRLRTVTDDIISNYGAIADNGQPFFVANGCHFWKEWSEIYDFPRRGSYGFDEKVRPVDHHSLRISEALVTPPFLGGGGMPITPLQSGVLFGPEALALMVPPVPETVWFEQSRLAFISFSDQFPEEMSLGNFLLELDDLAAIIPKLEKTISKTLAGVFLNYSFNVKPLLKDLSALFNMCTSVKSRIDFLRKTRGKPTRINFRSNGELMTAPSTIVWDQPPYYGPGGNILEFSFENFECRYTAGAFLLQSLTHLDDFYGLLRAYCGKTGLNNPLKVAWNAIPFSFVLDWFIPVSSYLARFKVQGADGQWILIDPTCSILQTCDIRVTQLNHFSGVRTVLGVVHQRRYSRLVGLPVPLVSLPEIHALSEKQLALLLAMST